MTSLAERHVTLLLTRAPDARRVRFGTRVAYGTVRTTDETVDDGVGGNKRVRMIVVTLPTDAFSTCVEGDTLIVYATKLPTSTQTSYVVRDRLLVDDGLLVRYRVVPSS